MIYKEADKTEIKKIPVTGSFCHAGRGALGKFCTHLEYAVAYVSK